MMNTTAPRRASNYVVGAVGAVLRHIYDVVFSPGRHVLPICPACSRPVNEGEEIFLYRGMSFHQDCLSRRS
jgi:hypothetical protein